jgi:murein DD-endopeptidase MepM/ murein hydrolase activator NlpD
VIGWPLDSNIIRRGTLSNTFGRVRHNADGSIRPHQGWDFFAAPGTPCYAVAAGSVAAIRTVGDYGNTLVLRFEWNGKTMYAAYSHLSRIDVKVNDRVALGQQVGLTGNTGNATSMRGPDCHLHFEFRSMPTPGLGLNGRYSPMDLFGVCPLDVAVERVRA